MDKIDIMFLVVIMIGLVVFLIGFSIFNMGLTVAGIIVIFLSIPLYEIITDYQIKKS